DDQDYLRVLGMLVYEYEEKNEQFPELTDRELLQTLMEDYNLKISDLLGIFQEEEVILDILNGKRKLNAQETFKVRSALLMP
ncbi:MAG: transcriptional regulator, partial [Symploca sp. SIO1A3]|nr:transcriptional regulator [Symploca sp. SIO1A3]